MTENVTRPFEDDTFKLLFSFNKKFLLRKILDCIQELEATVGSVLILQSF